MTPNNWKSIFTNQIELRKELVKGVKNGISHLKFNRSYLIVSDISSQFYSEAKLELDYIFGKIKTKEQQEGTELHDRMAEDSVIIKFEDLIKKISQSEKIVIIETIFLMKFQDEIIVGKPDIIIFKRGIPILLFDYKFSKHSNTTFPSQRVQGEVYCQILKELGYNTDLLFYGIIVAPRDMTKKSNNVKKIPQRVLQRIDISSLIQKQEFKLNFGKINVFLYKFNSKKTNKNLEWALEYWNRKRNLKISELLKECRYYGNKGKCRITYTIINDLVKKFPDNIITIYGIGSFFDRKLPSDWIKNDLDMICVVKDMEKIPKTQNWTEVRKLDYKDGKFTANVFFNSLEGLQHKEVYEKESWANYKWGLLDFKIPQNSVVLYGKPLFDELPEIDSIPFDYEDILRHAFYSINLSFTIREKEAAISKFTKGIFKFAFLLCVYFDEFFKSTSIFDISIKISKLVKDGKLDDYIYDMVLASIKYRRAISFSEEFSALRKKFVVYCFFLLFEGKLWKEYSWKEIIEFCQNTYKGFYSLENIANDLQ